jgi:hypothetical protein
MMSNDFHAPIPTTYKGITYRSRLEARWAVFFEEIGIEFEYEAEPIRSKSGAVLYMPDFVIYSGIRCKDWTERYFFEIKPAKPNEQYVSRLASLPLPLEVDLIIVVGEPGFNQPLGTLIEHIDRDEVRRVNGIHLLQCGICGQYNPLSKKQKAPECCFHGKLSSAKDASRLAKKYRFDL